MATGTAASEYMESSSKVQMPPARPRRLWLPGLFVVSFWTLQWAAAWVEKPYFIGFLYSMAAPALFVLLFFIWWWTNRHMPWSERLYGLVLPILTGILTIPICHKSIWFGLATLGLPLVLSTWTFWMIVARRIPYSWNWLGYLVVVLFTWFCFTLIRVDGLNGELQAVMRWRWTPTAEELFLAGRTHSNHLGSATVTALKWTPGDWTSFRGPNRDGVINGAKIATDWTTAPPRLIWRQRVGPAWSSVLIVGGRLFTQEQRSDQETVVCYEALTGKEIWAHEDRARFWEAVSGAGPRATPTFDEGRLYTLGATGILNSLDSVSGKCYWSRDILADAGAKAPLWGLSGSPLICDDLVIVFAGGDRKSLNAYYKESGQPAWTAPTSTSSYSSPQLLTIAGQRQCLLMGDGGLTGIDPVSGSVLWHVGNGIQGAPIASQPHLLDENHVAVASLDQPGISLIEISHNPDVWTGKVQWSSKRMNPEFPDFVVHQGHLYGFDLGTFCCIDLVSGERCWRQGRYGRGQVMLLPEQSLLLVISEKGEAALLKAISKRHEVLGHFQALNGKTWNHPVVAHGHLFVRNDEEMACYNLKGK